MLVETTELAGEVKVLHLLRVLVLLPLLVPVLDFCGRCVLGYSKWVSRITRSCV